MNIVRLKSWASRLFSNRLALAVVILFGFGYVFLWLTGSTNSIQLADNLIAMYLVTWGLYGMTSRVSRQEVRSRFVTVTVTLLLCLAALEIPAVLRLVNYQDLFSTPGSPNWWNIPQYVEDPELVWIHTPHYQKKGKYVRGNVAEALCATMVNDVREYDVRYDQHGFRNQTDLTSADIAVVGDSFVESPQTPYDSLMTNVLGNLQHASVANLGISGYGPQQELIVLKRFALPLRPKTIVWVFYEGNDLNDVQRYEDSLHLTAESRPPQSVLSQIWTRSFLNNLLSTFVRLRDGCQSSSAVGDYYALVKDAQGRETRQYFISDLFSTPAKHMEAMSITRTSLSTAHQLSRQHGFRLVVVFAPTEYRVYSDVPSVIEFSDKTKDWRPSNLPSRLRSMVADIDPKIDFIDLTPVFRDEVSRYGQPFLSDDTHWSDAGHALVARTIHDALINGSPAYVVQNVPDQQDDVVVLDQNDSALMVRDADGTIRYWNKGAQELYGFTSSEALGKSSHSLLKTQFPKPLPAIEREMMEKKFWYGELVHRRRDGSKVFVRSRWDLQQNPKDKTITVLEVNSKNNS
ncbi:alginate O-acetyltransferase AlgX-related protein [Nitrospira japonica]|nr:PAS domain-containing protein [Nitrospira japonica]